MNIVFFGTPEFAVISLKKLVEAGISVLGVVTAPDRPAGRGLKVKESEVKQYAKQELIPVLQPEKLKDQVFQEELKNLKADLFVVVAFRMLPAGIWQIPPRGTINLHASLLPDYRGAAPINWAIIRGENVTGITTFFINERIDTGDILLSSSLEIDEEETAGSLHDKLAQKGAELLLKTIKGIEQGSLKPTPQKANVSLKIAPKISREDCQINWSDVPANTFNLIRGMSPYPAAWTILDQKVFKIYQTKLIFVKHDYAVSSLLTDGKSFLYVAVPGGYMVLEEVQLGGKKRMPVQEFLKGYSFQTNKIMLG